MKRDPTALRDQAAEPTLRRIRADAERVSDVLKPALEVIERRLFDRRLNVNEVWRESGLSKEVSPLFTAQLRETPANYIGRCRFEVAAELLAATDLKVTQIATLLGYSELTDTFLKSFLRRSKLSPTSYRKAARAGGAGAEDGPLHAALESVSKLVDRAGRAFTAGKNDGAYHTLSRATAVVRDEDLRKIAGLFGLALHERGADRSRDGDVDRSYDDLTLARGCYAAAGELPADLRRFRRHVAISPDTDEALLSALCPDCRAKLAGPEGRTVRHELRLALRLVPRDLEWFEVCCDDCYRVVWSAISRARAGLMDDAWKAWWISVNADLEVREFPPSRGRIIAALAEVERLVSGDQAERKRYCDLALHDAMALGDPLLATQARIWRASVLRAMGEFTEAREELRKTEGAHRADPWLAALHHRMTGILERATNHWQESLALLRSATAFYRTLDSHISGVLLTEQATAYFFLAEYATGVACNEEALSLLDSRRDPLPGDGIVPVNLAGHYALLGDWASAELALSRCRFERESHPGLAAMEVFTRACLELFYEREQDSVRLFSEAKERFENLHRHLDAALAASYSVEAHARLGNRASAVDNAVSAFSFFQAAGCTQDTLEAVGKLRALLEADVVDVIAVTSAARRLARHHGGCLPEPQE